MTTHRTPYRSAAVTLATALALSACGGDNGDNGGGGGSGGDNGDEHNAADVTFAQAMIPHHQQAVEMAELALDQASSEEVRALAEEIRAAQAPEIDTLTDWLDTWGEEAPAAAMDHSGHADHDMPGTDGMDGMDGMAELANASGPAFDAAFLELMIEHHQGAIEMARAERTEGSYEPATALAEAIVTSQSTEIERMAELLPAD
ncbi:DUF305 domain-containing protein [Streptomyces sp. NBC_01803]|uniref:DUF305 domain-containing protein n=1 Tax=Streptomyces sp. NBC_01803 TaxID=2975946 RepID=UPI002DDC152E|nr:DUF305 domain-containing protein [Streptomyces sp. NBC_01803]WSA44961.1 DUF305 domain-containing protein [Streptomyces sp. NBC_01803]